MRPFAAVCVLSLLIVAAAARPARAQAEPPVGVRAAGMGGAFTAVADDGSATFWNPAGLASGAFFSLVLDWNTLDHRSATLIALGTPPLGLSYYRTTTGELASGRNPFVGHHAGITLLHSIGDRLAVGGTLKGVRGIVSSDTASVGTTKFDADLGVIATGSLGRLGLSVRNLTEPEFAGPNGTSTTLERRIRAGIAINVSQKATAAADFDLTTAGTPRGDWREAALGLEARPIKKASIRGGFRWNTAGTAAPIGTVGGSFAVYGSTFADAQLSFGSEDGDRGWGVGLRFLF